MDGVMESIGKMLIIFGIVLMVLGLFLVMFEKLPKDEN